MLSVLQLFELVQMGLCEVFLAYHFAITFHVIEKSPFPGSVCMDCTVMIYEAALLDLSNRKSKCLRCRLQYDSAKMVI